MVCGPLSEPLGKIAAPGLPPMSSRRAGRQSLPALQSFPLASSAFPRPFSIMQTLARLIGVTAAIGSLHAQAPRALARARQMVVVITPAWDSTSGTLRYFERTSDRAQQMLRAWEIDASSHRHRAGSPR